MFSQSCNTQPCNVQPTCYWTQWGSWTNCSAACEGGTTDRYRQCYCNGVSSLPEKCGGVKEDLAQWVLCNLQPCSQPPPPCSWSSWSGWSACDATCGGGTTYRIRTCVCGVVPSMNSFCNGTISDNLIQLPCNTNPCVTTTCLFTQWSSWSQCSTTCGIGTIQRSRDCVCVNPGFPAPFPVLGYYCSTTDPALLEIGYCVNNPCVDPPPVCSYSQWSEWTGCPSQCFPGAASTRQRTCLCNNVPYLPAYCGGDAMSIMESFICYVACPNNTCAYSQWTSWTPCSPSCGYGSTDRFRDCLCNGVPANYTNCGGTTEMVLMDCMNFPLALFVTFL